MNHLVADSCISVLKKEMAVLSLHSDASLFEGT